MTPEEFVNAKAHLYTTFLNEHGPDETYDVLIASICPIFTSLVSLGLERTLTEFYLDLYEGLEVVGQETQKMIEHEDKT